MTTDEIISRCYEHGQPDYVLVADRLKALQAEVVSLREANNTWVTLFGPVPSPSATGAAEPVAWPQHIPFALWADKIERTTRLVKVREVDSYGPAMYAAHIDCFYDFEAKRLVALLRSLATPPVKRDRSAFYSILTKYYPKDATMDAAWQELKEAGVVL